MADYKRSVSSGYIVVTGASTGIGETTALLLDRLGFHVFAGVRKDADGENLKSKASSRLVPIKLDVTNQEQITQAAATVKEKVGSAGLVGLVNNAGVAIAGPLEFLPLDEMRRQLDINVIGLVAVTQAFLPLLRQGHGRIVLVGSVSGRSSMPMLGPYAASKFAVEALTDSLRAELLHSGGVKVALIEPGSVVTPIWDKSRREGAKLATALPPEGEKYYGKMVRATLKLTENITKTAMPASKVAEAIEHALTATKPKTRYLLGRDARAQTLMGLLPDKMRDRLILLALNRLG